MQNLYEFEHMCCSTGLKVESGYNTPFAETYVRIAHSEIQTKLLHETEITQQIEG